MGGLQAGAPETSASPAALVDLDALDRNVARLTGALEGTGKTLRVASKSVRHVGLLRRILERGGDRVRGLMCFTLEEACFLADEGFDDLLVAYPSVQRAALDAVAERVARGATMRVMADHRAHLEAYGAAGRRAGVTLEALVRSRTSPTRRCAVACTSASCAARSGARGKRPSSRAPPRAPSACASSASWATRRTSRASRTTTPSAAP
ncbi:MAG: alanine racemase [Sandaracinaceae bacterium]|nr:alanine racemase [Sandaracinaceae bacterium]